MQDPIADYIWLTPMGKSEFGQALPVGSHQSHTLQTVARNAQHKTVQCLTGFKTLVTLTPSCVDGRVRDPRVLDAKENSLQCRDDLDY